MLACAPLCALSGGDAIPLRVQSVGVLEELWDWEWASYLLRMRARAREMSMRRSRAEPS